MTPTVALLAPRLADIPAALTATLARPRLDLAVDDARLIITGGGLSEGPARFCAALAALELGRRASFVSLSAFAGRYQPRHDDVLVLFSQGLAPNAQLPLRHLDGFARAVVFTSVVPGSDSPGGRLLAELARPTLHVETLPPASESGLLIRVIGSATQALAATRWLAGELPALRQLPARYAACLARPLPPLARDGAPLPEVALVASGRYLDFVFAHRWKLLEGLRLPDPPIWDALQIAHGPFQQLHARPLTLIALERADTIDGALLARLERILRPHHRLLRLGAEQSSSPLAWFEHDALVNALVLASLRATGLDLTRWPGFGEDGPIYDVDRPLSDTLEG